MSRKPKISTDGTPPLSSNPFAALHGALTDLPEGDAAQAQPAAAPEPAAQGTAHGLAGKIVVRREKKGRGGKTATVIEGIARSPEDLGAMAKTMRKVLGCGAHIEGPNIVLTGEQTKRAQQWLLEQGARKVVVGN